MKHPNKPLPSLRLHYKVFITTTKWSAPTIDISTSNLYLFHT